MLEGLRAGRSDAWDRFVRLYAGGMSRWLEKKGLQPHDRDDVIQLVLKNAFVGIDRFQRAPDDGKPQFRPWLMTILKNARIDLQRQGMASGTVNEADLKGALLDEIVERLSQSIVSPESGVENALPFLRDIVAVAMAEAKQRFPRRWPIFWLKYSRNELTFREISEEVGGSERAARQAHFEILKWLRNRLGDTADNVGNGQQP
ncbi:hypothetical protein GC176_01955 [bacterium]|nr:hypothetical protein [bacterium]